MSKKNRKAELAKQQPVETRINLVEQGTSGLKAHSGFVSEAYNAQLYYPAVVPLYNRIWRSMPEMAMVRNAFTAWGRNVNVEVDLPDEPSDDDKRYQDFVYEVFDDIEGGKSKFLETVVSRVPFYGWSWFSAPACVRNPAWKSPDAGDEWRSQYDDGLIGFRRLAFRDPSTFVGWDMDEKKRLKGMKQQDYPMPQIVIPLDESLHITYGDTNNPEGLAGLEAVWRLERIKFGLEVVYGIGMEHAAGYLNVQKTQPGDLSSGDKSNIAAAAKAIMSAQEGNYAAFPYGIEGEVKDINFSAAGSLLEGIKHYSILSLSVFMMQFIALNTQTDSGSYAAADDSSQLAVFTFNSMLDGFAAQMDGQIGRRLYEWNKDSFPGVTSLPKLRFTHIDKSVPLGEIGAFLQQTNGILALGEDDIKAIRKRSGFLSAAIPDEPIEKPEPTPEEQAEEKADDDERKAQEAKQIVEQSLYTTSRSKALGERTKPRFLSGIRDFIGGHEEPANDKAIKELKNSVEKVLHEVANRQPSVTNITMPPISLTAQMPDPSQPSITFAPNIQPATVAVQNTVNVEPTPIQNNVQPATVTVVQDKSKSRRAKIKHPDGTISEIETE